MYTEDKSSPAHINGEPKEATETAKDGAAGTEDAPPADAISALKKAMSNNPDASPEQLVSELAAMGFSLAPAAADPMDAMNPMAAMGGGLMDGSKVEDIAAQLSGDPAMQGMPL